MGLGLLPGSPWQWERPPDPRPRSCRWGLATWLLPIQGFAVVLHSSVTVGPSEGPFRLGNGLKEAHREPLGQTLGFPREAESTVASRPHRALSRLAGPEAPRSAPRIFLLPFTSIARPPCQGTLTRRGAWRRRFPSPPRRPRGLWALLALQALSFSSLCRAAAGLQSCIWQDDVC